MARVEAFNVSSSGQMSLPAAVCAIAADAADLAARLLLGGAAAVHLASARTLGAADPVLVSWDRRLSAAALEAGLSVAPSGFWSSKETNVYRWSPG